MGDITPPYTPTDGTVFNPSGWNGDFYSLTDGASVYGEMNGRIQDANFAAGQQVGARHVRPFEGFRSEFSGALETLDFHEPLFGSYYHAKEFLPIPGASKRVYLPWSASAVVFRASCFVTNFRMRKGPAAGQDIVTAGPNMYVALFMNGALAAHTARRLPMTYFPVVNPGDADNLFCAENYLSHHFDLMDVFDSSGFPPMNDVDVDLRVLVLENEGTEELFPLYDSDAQAKTTHSVTHRIRGGIRSASIIGLY